MKSKMVLLSFSLLSLVLLNGCQSSKIMKLVTPSQQPYSFISELPEFGEQFAALYPYEGIRAENAVKLSAFIAEPKDYDVCFSEHSSAWPLNNPGKKVLDFKTGVYPFYIFKNNAIEYECDKEKAPHGAFQGALVVYNLDETIELVTFGRSKETLLFSQELIDKVKTGMLTNYTISYDNTPRVSYWIGNRRDLFQGGASTVELDFSRNTMLEELRVNDEIQPSLSAVLPVYTMATTAEKIVYRKPLQHKLFMRLKDGREFKGYIKNIKDNAYTAFMKIPCKIPEKLFDAAAKGTISKLDITAAGDASEEITQIVFGYHND